MRPIDLLTRSAGAIARARVVAVHDTGVLVEPPDGGDAFGCDLLDAGGGVPLLARGDTVLVYRDEHDPRGVVVGRVGPSSAAPPAAEPPDELVLEAKQQLVLRVADGSITLREDGRILIKGKDLVSHAERMNRIRGGAVSIN